MTSKNLAERFHARVGPKLPNGCMEWQSYCQPNGYGRFGYAKSTRAFAHRIAYSLTHGEIPEGMVVMHTCDNRRCVNVEHLRLGTQLENIADTKSKGRTKRSKLTPHLKEILRLRAEGFTHQSIAERYGVSRPLVTMLFTGLLLTNFGAT